MDMWTTGYLNPILEANQDIKNAEGKVEDGVTTIKFTRARDTGDSGQVWKFRIIFKNCRRLLKIVYVISKHFRTSPLLMTKDCIWFFQSKGVVLMESIRKLENMKKHQAFLPSGFSSNLAALQMVSLQTNNFRFRRLRKHVVKSTQHKKLAPNTLRFTY